MKDADCIHFLQWALSRLGFRWAVFRRVRGPVCKRLGGRMTEQGLKELSDYRALLEKHPEESGGGSTACAGSASRASTGTRGCGAGWRRSCCTSRSGKPWRAASPGCASGEEPYTLALMFALGETPRRRAPEILVTDADP